MKKTDDSRIHKLNFILGKLPLIYPADLRVIFFLYFYVYRIIKTRKEKINPQGWEIISKWKKNLDQTKGNYSRTHPSVSSLKVYKCHLLVWRKVKQTFNFEKKILLALTDIEGIFFQRQFLNKRNVKSQIFQITFSTRQLWFQRYLLRRGETGDFIKSQERLQSSRQAVLGLRPLWGAPKSESESPVQTCESPNSH